MSQPDSLEKAFLVMRDEDASVEEAVERFDGNGTREQIEALGSLLTVRGTIPTAARTGARRAAFMDSVEKRSGSRWLLAGLIPAFPRRGLLAGLVAAAALGGATIGAANPGDIRETVTDTVGDAFGFEQEAESPDASNDLPVVTPTALEIAPADDDNSGPGSASDGGDDDNSGPGGGDDGGGDEDNSGPGNADDDDDEVSPTPDADTSGPDGDDDDNSGPGSGDDDDSIPGVPDIGDDDDGDNSGPGGGEDDDDDDDDSSGPGSGDEDNPFDLDDDNSGPGGDDDNSGPGNSDDDPLDPDDDNSGPGGDDLPDLPGPLAD